MGTIRYFVCGREIYDTSALHDGPFTYYDTIEEAMAARRTELELRLAYVEAERWSLKKWLKENP